MVITRETKERFVKMLSKREIIVIQCDKGTNRKNYNFKFIGANSGGKWDFTPLVVETSGYPSNRRITIERLSIYALDAAAVICDTLLKLQKEGVVSNIGNGYSLYQKVRGLLTTFQI